MNDMDNTYRFTVKIPLAKSAAKFHAEGPFLHHLMEELNASLRVPDEILGHPVNVNLGDEDV